ncbi:MAG TPA: hypothetical protein VKK79_08720 [Candidatus Lokiarchaeia archaeon]|nr:hypothetical protein [Candidatus Lokiarchaeia archaeon]
MIPRHRITQAERARAVLGLCLVIATIMGICWTHGVLATPSVGTIDTTGAIAIGRPFGMNSHGWGANPSEAADMAAAGMQIGRTDVNWAAIEQVPGVYDFSWYDNLWSNLSAKGVDILALLDYGNANLFGPTQSQDISTPAEVAAWLAYVNATVRHFDNGTSPIRQWEMWNEPNLSEFWNGTEEQFFSLVNVTGALIHSIDPNLLLLSPGISGPDLSYLDRLINYIGDANFSAWFGGLAFHCYSGSDAEVVASSIEGVQALCAQHHYYGHLWITEWGYSTTSDPTYVKQSFALQGSLLTKVYSLSLARNISRFFWYSFREDGFGVQYNPAAGYNTPGPEGQNVPDPAGYAFETLSTLLTDSTFLPGALVLQASFVPSSQLWAYAFLTATGHLVLVAWNSLGPYTLTLSSAATIAAVVQIDPLTGTNATLPLPNPSLALGTETPVIVDISFSGAVGPLTIQILPAGYTALVLFGLPALFLAGICACIWSYRKGERVILQAETSS